MSGSGPDPVERDSRGILDPWLLRQRLQRAQQLLETTDLAIDVVAESSGFQNAGNLRKHFHLVLRTTPQAYRRTFRSRAVPEALAG